MISRREFLQLSAAFGTLAAVGKLTPAHGAPAQDYKALVCVFMLGGNDGHNVIVPLDSAQYAAYQAARDVLALPIGQLLQINDPSGTFGLHYGLPELQTLFTQGKLAIVSNAGVLVQPTTYSDLSNPTVHLPSNLRSHANQIAAMQTGYPNPGGGTGWGGRILDQLEGYNGNTDFPVAISMDKPAVYCSGTVTQDITLQPGNNLEQQGLKISPGTAAQARLTGQGQIVAADSGNAIVDAANDVMADANALKLILTSAGGTPTFPKPFPSGELGGQLKEVVRLISLNAQFSVGRQVFFCSLGGFDTHAVQASRQSALLQEMSKALDAFYAALSFQGLDQQVTTFTLSDFGRTLSPSGTGTDHGWGNHQLVLGGAVNGGKIYGRFPLMTNYSNFNASAEDFADGRGTMLPGISLAQYGATLARWFGATDLQLDGIFPQLPDFPTRDLGFLA
jgi:uncharacterized protein (DUF1501 family)